MSAPGFFKNESNNHFLFQKRSVYFKSYVSMQKSWTEFFWRYRRGCFSTEEKFFITFITLYKGGGSVEEDESGKRRGFTSLRGPSREGGGGSGLSDVVTRNSRREEIHPINIWHSNKVGEAKNVSFFRGTVSLPPSSWGAPKYQFNQHF